MPTALFSKSLFVLLCRIKILYHGLVAEVSLCSEILILLIPTHERWFSQKIALHVVCRSNHYSGLSCVHVIIKMECTEHWLKRIHYFLLSFSVSMCCKCGSFSFKYFILSITVSEKKRFGCDRDLCTGRINQEIISERS